MATIKDIARLTNVDISTVSRALNNSNKVHPQTKERIVQVAKELAYRPNVLAQGLKEKHTHTIALLLPSFEMSVFTSVAAGVEAAAREHDYTVFFCNTMDDSELENEYIDKLKNRFVDGFVCAVASSNSNVIERLKKDKIPLVLTVRIVDEPVDIFALNYFKAAYDATIHLIGKGCRNIAMLNGPIEALPFAERYQGYLQALSDHGIAPDEQKIVNVSQSSPVNGFEGMIGLLEKNSDIDGALVSTDALAIGAVRAIKRKGLRIAEDIKLIDCTGNPITAMLETPLTVMEMPGFKIGFHATKRLIDIIEGRGDRKPSVVRFEAELIEREST
jgi:DNA-binding LacI/PurR family transcriptional regulator